MKEIAGIADYLTPLILFKIIGQLLTANFELMPVAFEHIPYAGIDGLYWLIDGTHIGNE